MKKAAKRALLTLTVGMSLAAFATTASASAYKVKADDTFWTISQAKGLSLTAVLNANPGVNPRNLQPGQTIQLPESGSYIAKSGDTFWLIAKKLNIPVQQLIAANPQVSARNIYNGLKITLPGGQAAAVHAQSADKATLLPADPVGSYSKVLDIVATAYSGSAEENGGWAGLDYFGNKLQVGTIAVDPKVIPLGSKVYITGYNSDGLPAGGMTAYAKDVGSAIKGNRVDIYLPGTSQQVSKFGMQNVKVYVLK
jgi:3D (Asp-Asp-Asp) domain-containing protein